MAETTDEIRRQIEAERGRLGRNLDELEARVRTNIDWRTHFARHTGLALGIAFGGGLLLSMMTSGPRRSDA